MFKFTRKKLLPVVITALIAVLVSSCSNDNYTKEGGEITSAIITTTETSAEDTVEVTNKVAEDLVVTITDREGNSIEIPDSIERIVSASPATTEILVGLGLADKIVAADFYSSNVIGINPEICNIDFYNLNPETLLALTPDLIIVNGISNIDGSDPYSELKSAGATTVYIPDAKSINSIKLDIEFLAAYTGTTSAGEKLISDIDRAVSKISLKTMTLPKKKVYFEIGAAPYLYTLGKDTFINEIIEICGGENIYGSEYGWISNSDESVVAGNPEIIISNVSFDGYDYNEIYKRAGWENIDAVKNGAVYNVNSDNSSRASQNVIFAIEEIAEIINPGIYLESDEIL